MHAIAYEPTSPQTLRWFARGIALVTALFVAATVAAIVTGPTGEARRQASAARAQHCPTP